MPELPEVETICRQLNQHLPGLVLQKLEFLDKKTGRFILEKDLEKVLEKKVVSVSRRAKVLLIEFVNKYYLAIHLKMTGQIILDNPKTVYLPNKHTRAILFFSKKKKVYFQDLRKFGWLKVVDKKTTQSGLLKQKLGPEPFGKTFSLTYFKQALKKSNRPIKVLLLDQSVIAGIGNIYANEALFLAKIHPAKPANQLKEKEGQRLYGQIKKVLQKGIDLGGSSDNDYLDAYGNRGKYQEHFLVYGRAKKPCVNCQTKIIRVALRGRGSFYCPQCQRL